MNLFGDGLLPLLSIVGACRDDCSPAGFERGRHRGAARHPALLLAGGDLKKLLIFVVSSSASARSWSPSPVPGQARISDYLSGLRT